MVKIKDRILLGTLGGTLSAFAARILNRINYNKGLTDIRYNQLAAHLMLPKSKTKTTSGILLGAIVNNINVAANGVMLTYILSATGKDHAILKGMGAGAFSWVVVDGLVASHVLKVKSGKPIGPIVHLAEHLFYGALCATFITQFGDDSLFPPKEEKPLERTPLVHTGIN